MAPRPHFADLRRRYREADWVSEYQRLWAIFNHWLQAHAGNTQDRLCVESLKGYPELAAWIVNRLQATAYPRPQRVGDGYVGSYPRFAADNEISVFFRAVSKSSVVEPRINYPWRPGLEPRVRISNAITLDQEQFLKAYRTHAQVLEEGIAGFHLTIDQTLPALGIHSTGCCFYIGEVDAGLPQGTEFWANRMVELFDTKPELAELVSLIRSAEKTTLSNDVVEILYNVRNVAMHGTLDFLNEQDNAAARAAYDLLDSLIRDIRDHW